MAKVLGEAGRMWKTWRRKGIGSCPDSFFGGAVLAMFWNHNRAMDSQANARLDDFAWRAPSLPAIAVLDRVMVKKLDEIDREPP